MDEVEIIQNHLLSQAGENTDVILGLGYDNSLEDQVGITLIATGFQHKDPFMLPIVKKPDQKEEKIIMVLGETNEIKPEEKKTEIKREVDFSTKEMLREELAPKLIENLSDYEEAASAFMMFDAEDLVRETEREFLPDEPSVIHWELNMQNSFDSVSTNKKDEKTTKENQKITVEKMSIAEKKEMIISENKSATSSFKKEESILKNSTTPVSAASGGYLARPSNIYAESQAEVFTSKRSAEEPVPAPNAKQDEEKNLDMQLVVKDAIQAADAPLAHQTQPPLPTSAEEPPLVDETEEQKRKAAERLHKLRNLSFNINSADPNNEFENVPAYIRRNMELYGNSFSAVENFYSNYEVKKDENNQTQISTINTFLDGNKPD
jgi:cell division protein FtsZ